MEYVIKLICKKDLKDSNLKVNDTVWLNNVFGKETFTRNRQDACRFISLVRVNKLVNQINDRGNFVATVNKVY